MSDFINKSGLDFVDISSEQWRSYAYSDGMTIIINNPVMLHVSKTGGHRVFDSQGVSHYVNSGWKHLQWKAKEGEPNFVK